MARVTFDGPVKSNGNFEVGQAGSGSQVAGTVVLVTGSTIQLQNVNINVSTATVTSINATSVTATSLILGATTDGRIIIGGAKTGWENKGVMLTPAGTNTSLNMNLGSVFAITAPNGNFTITPTGGYLGQIVTIYLSTVTTGTVTFGPGFGANGITMCSLGTLALGTSSAHTIMFVRMNETEMVEIARNTNAVTQKGITGSGIAF